MAVGAVRARCLSTEDVLFSSRSSQSLLFLSRSYCLWSSRDLFFDVMIMV